jgi:hypothetical protein
MIATLAGFATLVLVMFVLRGTAGHVSISAMVHAVPHDTQNLAVRAR